MRIDLPGDLGWIEVKDARSWADAMRIENASIAVVVEGGATRTAIDLLAEGIAQITTSVTAWSHSAPVTRDTLLSPDFDARYGNAVLEAVREFYAAQGRSSGEG